MKINVELFGDKIGVHNNLKNLIEKKECKLLFTVSDNTNTNRTQFILDREQVASLQDQINKQIADAVRHGFKVV